MKFEEALKEIKGAESVGGQLIVNRKGRNVLVGKSVQGFLILEDTVEAKDVIAEVDPGGATLIRDDEWRAGATDSKSVPQQDRYQNPDRQPEPGDIGTYPAEPQTIKTHTLNMDDNISIADREEAAQKGADKSAKKSKPSPAEEEERDRLAKDKEFRDREAKERSEMSEEDRRKEREQDREGDRQVRQTVREEDRQRDRENDKPQPQPNQLPKK